MPRGRNPNREKAKEMYLNVKGNIKLIDIAEQLGVLDTQIRKWKSQDKWDNELELKGTLPNNKRNVTNKNVSKNNTEKEPISEAVKEVMENDEINDKHKQFCILYSKRQNATKAYQKVYHCTYWTAAVEGNKLLKKPKIKEQINRLLEEQLNKEFLKKGLIQQYKDIAFSDMGDYVEFGKKRIPQWKKNEDGDMIPVMDPNTGEQMIKEYSYVELKDSVCVDTSLISEVSEGKDGIKFKLADKMKAMEVLSKLSNLLSDEEKTKLDVEYKKLQNQKLQEEVKKLKGEKEGQKEPVRIVDDI
jgi:phage terminase small subunit